MWQQHEKRSCFFKHGSILQTTCKFRRGNLSNSPEIRQMFTILMEHHVLNPNKKCKDRIDTAASGVLSVWSCLRDTQPKLALAVHVRPNCPAEDSWCPHGTCRWGSANSQPARVANCTGTWAAKLAWPPYWTIQLQLHTR